MSTATPDRFMTKKCISVNSHYILQQTLACDGRTDGRYTKGFFVFAIQTDFHLRELIAPDTTTTTTTTTTTKHTYNSQHKPETNSTIQIDTTRTHHTFPVFFLRFLGVLSTKLKRKRTIIRTCREFQWKFPWK